MSLPKLPCEYPILIKNRFKECFGDLSETQQLKIMETIINISKLVEV